MSHTQARGHVITGRGARIKHIAQADGSALCPRSNASRPAEGRFLALPVCSECTGLAAGQPDPSAAAPVQPHEDDSEQVTVHLSARVAGYLARTLHDEHPTLAADLTTARYEKCGRGFTAYVSTTSTRATTLLELMKTMVAEMNSGTLKTTGMGFRAEAVEKGVEHVGTDLFFHVAATA